jgi:tetratricopeptide (TPR) repeat protein
MQPYTAEFAQKELRPQEKPIVIGKVGYRTFIDPGKGYVLEQGPKGKKTYKIAHVLGGKNVYYFLTPLDRGRLQTLPVSYDVRKKEWFDTAGSGVRHFPGRRPDEPVSWKDWQYTFNTACYSCHVSQLSTNYTLKTNTYKTTWVEPGINCETCHGPADEHIRVCREAPKGTVPKDLKMIRGGSSFTVDQNNAAWADPQIAPAAYNLGVLLSADRPEEAIGFCRKASDLRPEDPRYSFTLAFYLYKKGDNRQALNVLDALLEKHPNYRDAQMLKREIAGPKTRP